MQVETETLDGLHFPKQRFANPVNYGIFWFGFADDQVPQEQPPLADPMHRPPEDLPAQPVHEVSFPNCPANVTRETRSAVARLHLNLGHPTEKELIRLLAWQGAASELMITAVKHIHCGSCHRLKRIPRPRPTTVPNNVGQFNDFLQADVFWCRDLTGTNFPILGISDQSTATAA